MKVSIHLWSPKSLGFTLFETQESAMITKVSLMGELMVLLGGRVAEEIFFGDKFSSGSAHDIEQAKKIAAQMVVNWGMGERIIYPSGSEFYRRLLEQEIDALIQHAFRETKTLLLDHSLKIQEMAERLVKTRELKYDELTKL
jgi:ATP-dependent Zn protease